MTTDTASTFRALHPWRCTIYGVLAGATAVISPSVLVSACPHLPGIAWVEGLGVVALCLALLSYVATRAAASVSGRFGKPTTSRALMACTAGNLATVVGCAGLCCQLSLAQGSGAHEAAGMIGIWYAIGGQAIVYGITFLIGAIVALFLDGLISKQHKYSAREELRLKVKAAFGGQQPVRHEAILLSEQLARLRQAEVNLVESSHRDGLTGLMNRVYLLAMLKKNLELRPKSSLQRKFLMHIDLDQFRTVNEFLGNHAGDMVLKQIAMRLTACTREDDLLVRLSGDEFAILFTRISETEKARRTAERILAAIEPPVNLDGLNFPITASVGICEISSQYRNIEDIIRDADAAMYRAKLTGGNKYVFYDSAMNDEAIGKIQTTLQIKSAVSNDEFALFYQPLVDMRDCSIYGVEALIRWNHPKRGLLSAGEFIQHAEDAGYSVEIGQWTLLRACADAKMIQETIREDLLMSVNISARQLESESFIHELKSVLRSSGIDPHMLQLEIVESAFLRDAVRVGKMFETIRSMGVRIALDDFGTGYSCLSYLQKFPIDTLKIDQSFIRGIHEGSINSYIVRFLIELAESTKMRILAEGVEVREHVDVLTANGCYLAQGYLYSRPVCLDDLRQLLVKGVNCAEPANRRARGHMN